MSVQIDRIELFLVFIGGYGLRLLYLNGSPVVGLLILENQSLVQKTRRKVTLYTKPGCHLCDEAKEEIEASGSKEFDLVEINIAGDPDLYEQYKYEIPVILIDGTEAFRHRLTAADFLRALKQN